MAKVSVIIPSYCETLPVATGETVLQRTVRDLHEKAAGEVEIIVVFDGPPYQELPDYVQAIHAMHTGTKVAINRAAAVATGEWLFKLDSHCMVAPGFDETLQDGCEENWLVQPRFYVLDAEKWDWQDNRYYDYFKLPCPFEYQARKGRFLFQAGGHWPERNKEREETEPWDETMKLHGSCFFTSKHFYWDVLGGLDATNGAGTWNGEDVELSLKTWLGPWSGRVMVNKSTWYAHMHRGAQRPREWKVDYKEAYRSAEWTANYWMMNRWQERAHDIEWLIHKFWPIPGWPDNWTELLSHWREANRFQPFNYFAR